MNLGWYWRIIVLSLRIYAGFWLSCQPKEKKDLHVWNHWTNFNIILQKCSFDDPLPRLFKPPWFAKNIATMGRGLFYRKLSKSFQKPLVWFQCNFEKMSFSFVTHYKECSSHRDSSKIKAAGTGVCMCVCVCGGGVTDFNIILQKCPFLLTHYKECSSHRDSPKIKAARAGGGVGRGGLFSLYIYIEKFKKSSCQNPLNWFQYNMAEILLW